MEEESRRGKEKRIDCQENLCLGIGVENKSRVMVLVFVNWNLYKNNWCWFSSQRVRGFGPFCIAYMLCILSIYVHALVIV